MVNILYEVPDKTGVHRIEAQVYLENNQDAFTWGYKTRSARIQNIDKIPFTTQLHINNGKAKAISETQIEDLMIYMRSEASEGRFSTTTRERILENKWTSNHFRNLGFRIVENVLYWNEDNIQNEFYRELFNTATEVNIRFIIDILKGKVLKASHCGYTNVNIEVENIDNYEKYKKLALKYLKNELGLSIIDNNTQLLITW